MYPRTTGVFSKQPQLRFDGERSSTTMMNDSIPADLTYLGEVLQSDLAPSAKLFFASLMTESAFRTRFGICRSEWNEHPEHLESVRSLEEAGLISVTWDGTRIQPSLLYTDFKKNGEQYDRQYGKIPGTDGQTADHNDHQAGWS